jgi:hypothetical protein
LARVTAFSAGNSKRRWWCEHRRRLRLNIDKAMTPNKKPRRSGVSRNS